VPGKITLQEAADRLGVHYMTAYRYVRTGRLPATRDGVQWLVDPADLKRLRARRVPKGSGRVRSEGPVKLAARMVAGDEAGAWAVLDAALGSGVTAADVHMDLLVPALDSIGEQWAEGVLTVADEHRASVIAQRLIGRLGPQFARRGRKRGTVVLGMPAGERHSLPGAILADLLRGAGFEVLDTGADTPPESFVETATFANRLVTVVLGSTTPGHDATLRATIRALRGAGVEVPVLVGGAAIVDEAHARRLGADAWSGPDGRCALAAVELVASGGGG
jgi:excisionase family DNA binding protein